MTPFLPCGGCAACERCEALRWACGDQTAAAPNPLASLVLAHVVDPACAAELLRVLLEARGIDVALFGTNGERCGTGRDVKIYTYSDGVAWWCTGDKRPAFPPMSAVAALILALLSIPPGEQREAALRVVEEAR